MIFTHFKRILDYLGILLFMISMGIFIVLWTALLLKWMYSRGFLCVGHRCTKTVDYSLEGTIITVLIKRWR